MALDKLNKTASSRNDRILTIFLAELVSRVRLNYLKLSVIIVQNLFQIVKISEFSLSSEILDADKS